MERAAGEEEVTAEVLTNFFRHEHNALEVATQEYRLAKKHFRDVMHYRDCTDQEHQKQFRDALNRQEVARERYVEALMAR
jgi:hypothetical protein